MYLKKQEIIITLLSNKLEAEIEILVELVVASTERT